MKIAVIHSFYAGSQASGENAVVENQLAMLRSKGHSVMLYSKVTELESSNRFYTLQCVFRILSRRGANFSRELSYFNPDLILVHNLFPNISSYWLRSLDSKKIFFLHNLRPWCSNGFMLRKSLPCNKCLRSPLWGTVHRCANGNLFRSFIQSINQLLPSDLYLQQKNGAYLVAVSEISKNQIERIDSRLNIQSIPNFTYTYNDRFPEYEFSKHKIKIQPKFVWVGRISPEKGLRQLLEIWPDDHHLDIIGNGPDFEKLKNFFLPKKNIKFLGYRSNLEIIGMLSGYLAMVNSSLWAEFGPLTVIEALACGLPVIVTSSLPIAKEISQFQAGLTYDIKSKASLTQSLRTTLESKKRESFSKAAVTLHSNLFSFENWYRSVMKI